jgi:cation diffusion facilitator CzcD-associated flavoprotein CzcO
MTEQLDVAVVGTGPFGLSIGAHVATAARVRAFGPPMETWRTRMPPDMLLRSAWAETSLSAPGGAGTIDAWAREAGEPREEPIPLAKFLRYADWFRERFVPAVDPAHVASVEPAAHGYTVRTSDGGVAEARNVVLAVGVTPFGYAPPPLDRLLGDGAAFATDQHDYDRFRGRRVIVVGGGQSALESAGLAAAAGGAVELIVRSRVRWFADREPHHERGPVASRLYRLAYPAVGYGPPPLNRLVLHPDLFAALPRGARRRLNARLLRPGGSPWLRELVEGRVRITEGTSVRTAERRDHGFRLTLTDTTTRDADDILLATGYRFSLDRLPFLSAAIREQIRTDGRWPVLDRYFRSTAPNIFLVGYAAEDRFGPLSRFVLGTDFTARRVASCLIV